MKPQERTWSCGAAALRNAIRARWGLKIREGVIRKLAGSSPAGTDEEGIKQAAHSLGFKTVETWTANRSQAWDWLRGSLLSGKPVILCFDAWEHWVVAIGMLGDRVCIYDPARFNNNRAEDGVHVLDQSKLMYRWWNARKSVGDSRRAYALAIYR